MTKRVPGTEIDVEQRQKKILVGDIARDDLLAYGRIVLAFLAEIDLRHQIGGLVQKIDDLALFIRQEGGVGVHVDIGEFGAHGDEFVMACDGRRGRRLGLGRRVRRFLRIAARTGGEKSDGGCRQKKVTHSEKSFRARGRKSVCGIGAHHRRSRPRSEGWRPASRAFATISALSAC